MEEKKCTSCNSRITNKVGSSIFKCPNCSETEIIRCNHCREIGAKFKCHKCEFEGPN